MTSSYDLRLKYGSSMLIAGPSECGKSTFITELLINANTLFEREQQQIHWFYGQGTDALQNLPPHIRTQEGLPGEATLHDIIEPYNIIVLDDLMEESKEYSPLTILFTRAVHHKKLFVINITQNYYQQSRDARTRRLNTHYLVLFKNPVDLSQVHVLGRQMFPTHNKFLVGVYHEVTKRPYGYLFIDLKQETVDGLRVRTNVLPSQYPMQVFNHKQFGFCSSNLF
jgi:polynucleotide 5'-kinase involved in rRNA processing